jgi:hypothetical protein
MIKRSNFAQSLKQLIFQIKSLIIDYQPGIDPELKPGRVVRGTTQILVRLIKDKVWSIFCAAVSIANVLYGHFVFVNPVAKKELSESGNFLFICVFISLCVCVFLSPFVFLRLFVKELG